MAEAARAGAVDGVADNGAVLDERRSGEGSEIHPAHAAGAAPAAGCGRRVTGDGAIADGKSAGGNGAIEVDAAGGAVHGRVAGDGAVLQEQAAAEGDVDAATGAAVLACRGC